MCAKAVIASRQEGERLSCIAIVSAAVLFFARLVAPDLRAQPDNASPEPGHAVRSASAAGDDFYAHVREEYFHQLDELVVEHDVYVAHHAPENAVDSTDRLLSSMLEEIPMVYLRAYLEKEIPRAAASTKTRLELVLQRLEYLREIDFGSREARSAFVKEAGRDQRVSTLLVCLGALLDTKRRVEAAHALAAYKEPRVIRFLVGIAAQGVVGGHDNQDLVQITLQNAIIKSLSALTGRRLALIDQPPHSMLFGESAKLFSARLVAARRQEAKRCLDAAMSGARWLRRDDLRRAAAPEAESGDKSTRSRDSALGADLVDDIKAFAWLRLVYGRVVEQYIYRFNDAAVDASESAGERIDRLLSSIVEEVPAVYLREHLDKLIPHISGTASQQWHQRLLDRVEELGGLERPAAQTLIADAARDRRVSMLLLYVAAMREPTCRAQAATALASFQEPRVIRCLCNTLLAPSPGAAPGDTDTRRDQFALLNSIIKCLGALTGLDLALIEPPPRRSRDGDDDGGISALLLNVRREAVNCRLDAVERCEKWLDQSARRDNDSRD